MFGASLVSGPLVQNHVDQVQEKEHVQLKFKLEMEEIDVKENQWKLKPVILNRVHQHFNLLQ